MELLYTPDSIKVWGLIGPDDNPGVANFIAPLSANSGLMTVSLCMNEYNIYIHALE